MEANKIPACIVFSIKTTVKTNYQDKHYCNLQAWLSFGIVLGHLATLFNTKYKRIKSNSIYHESMKPKIRAIASMCWCTPKKNESIHC